MLWCASLLSARTGKDDDEDAGSSSADESGEQATPKKGASDKESGSGSPPGKPGKKEDKWFDESKARKAERCWEQQMEGLRRDMDALSKDMASTLSEFRSSPSDAQTFASEMLLVQKRGEWLAAVAEQDESSLNLKISAQVGDLESDSITESRDASAVSRAGPCAGFESLKTVAALTAEGSKFRACSSQDEIKKCVEALIPQRKVIQTLMAACKSSMNELTAAKKKAKAMAEKQKEKELKEAAADKKRGANAAGAGGKGRFS